MWRGGRAGAVAGLHLVLSCACVHELAAFGSRAALPVCARPSVRAFGRAQYVAMQARGRGGGGRASAFCHELLPLVRAHRGRALRPWRRVGAPRVFPWLLPLSPVLARGDRRRGGHLAEWQHRGARRCLDCDVQVPSPLSAFVCLPGASCASTQTCEPRCVSPGRAEGLLALQSVLRSFSEDGIDFCRTGAPSCARWHRAAWPPQCMCPPPSLKMFMLRGGSPTATANAGDGAGLQDENDNLDLSAMATRLCYSGRWAGVRVWVITALCIHAYVHACMLARKHTGVGCIGRNAYMHASMHPCIHACVVVCGMYRA